MRVPPTRVTGSGIHTPIATLEAAALHVVHESRLPLAVHHSRGDMAPVLLSLLGGFVRPIPVAAEFADHHGITGVTKITEVLFPTRGQTRGLDDDTATDCGAFQIFQLRTFRLGR